MGKGDCGGSSPRCQAANKSLKRYERDLDAVRRSSYAYVADQMTPSHDETNAWRLFAEGRVPEATKLLLWVTEKQDRKRKREVEISAREMLADMLQESNQPAEALKQYELSLQTDPNRWHSLAGAAHATEASQQNDRARGFYTSLHKGREQVDNPELVCARAYMGIEPVSVR